MKDITLSKNQEQAVKNFIRLLKEAEAIGKTGKVLGVFVFNSGGLRASDLLDILSDDPGYFNKRD